MSSMRDYITLGLSSQANCLDGEKPDGSPPITKQRFPDSFNRSREQRQRGSPERIGAKGCPGHSGAADLSSQDVMAFQGSIKSCVMLGKNADPRFKYLHASLTRREIVSQQTGKCDPDSDQCRAASTLIKIPNYQHPSLASTCLDDGEFEGAR